MKVIFVSSEAVPFAKTGGLGDVVGSLPAELNKQGAQVRIIMPLYKSIKEACAQRLVFHEAYNVPLGWRNCHCGLFSMEAEGLTYYFLDNEQYFFRDEYYGHYDDGERFAFFCKACLESLEHIDFKPDILHCSDWQTALIPIYLKTHYKNSINYKYLRTVFTIHNIEYQGIYGMDILEDVLGIDKGQADLLLMNGNVNFMKGAIVTCDRLTTVSPSYAEEIIYPFFAHGLHTIIKENRYKLSGIINGIDFNQYNPYRDKAIYVRYSKNTPEKKALNKAALKKDLGLSSDPDVPLIGMIGRLVEHKGMPLVTRVFDQIMYNDINFVLLGTGDKHFEDFFLEKASQYHGRIAVITAFSGDLASRIYAASDLFLMPSISEPCGLAQMIALRYGAVPIVRATGGLKDSIKPFNIEKGTGNGIRFDSVNAHDMLDAIKRALSIYNDSNSWSRIVRNAFNSDNSWRLSAKKYFELYKTMLT